tara:strand:+ start:16625 stop:17173 length:549 start_codon:yes stop_codon:yes gene_type:complete
MVAEFIKTRTGLMFYFNDIEPDKINIIDIAHHLSNLCKFTGAVKEFYSIAEHSVVVSNLVPLADALSALMHDASEAYLNDINTPAKRLLPDYKALEKKVQSAIEEKYGFVSNKNVVYADTTALVAEAKELMGAACDEEWFGGTIPDYDERFKYKSIPMTPRQANKAFLRRFFLLTGGKFPNG